MVFQTIRAEGSLLNVLEWEQEFAEQCDEKRRSREKRPFAVRYETYGSVALLLRFCTHEKLPAKATSSRETALANGDPDWSGGGGCDEGLECSNEFSRLRKF